VNEFLAQVQDAAEVLIEPGAAPAEKSIHVRVPILIAKGENDPYATMEQVWFAERECYCPVEYVVIGDAAHAPHRERPEQTLAAAAGFINRLLREHGEAKAT
jgi:pimeloyl-ACP methyl ester carboxylesterase